MRSGVATLRGTDGQGTPLATTGGTRVPSCGSSRGACEGIPELSRAAFIHWLLPRAECWGGHTGMPAGCGAAPKRVPPRENPRGGRRCEVGQAPGKRPSGHPLRGRLHGPGHCSVAALGGAEEMSFGIRTGSVQGPAGPAPTLGSDTWVTEVPWSWNRSWQMT